MKLALIGYGKMGHAIERIAIERGHKIVSIIDADNQDDFNTNAFRSADVAIEFSTPQSAFPNYVRAFAQGVKVVSGSTGWLDNMNKVRNLCDDGNASFFYSSNFSIGVNIFFSLNRYLARIMERFPQYDVKMNEIHHIHKLDHPSGTAISLANDIVKNLSRKDGWTEDGDAPADKLLVEHQREGEVPGIHMVEYDSNVDRIVIEHEAFSREGFALGAVMAAEWMKDKVGFHTMDEMMDLK